MNERSLIASALLFDMDGTLIDSSTAVVGIWSKWARRHGLNADSILERAHGRQTIDVMREFAPDLDLNKETADFLEWEISWRDGIHAVRGAEELLERLPANVWAVVTSAERELAKARFSAAGLPMPEILISAEDVSQGKPNPEGFLKAAEQMSVQASNCVVFEDSWAGLEAGEESGASVVMVAIDGSSALEVGMYAIRDFTDLDLAIDSECITIRFRGET